MTYAARSPGLLSRLWEWLGWRSTKIAEHRTQARTTRADAEQRLVGSVERAEKSRVMSEWLANRSRENHIAEALLSSLDHPRPGRTT